MSNVIDLRLRKSWDFYHPSLPVGGTVIKSWDNNSQRGIIKGLEAKQVKRNKFTVAIVEWEDGSVTEEHPEHLSRASKSDPTEGMSDMGKFLFDMMADMNRARNF